MPRARNYSSAESVVDTVRTWLRSGRLRPGDRIPTTRAIEVELGVARGTVCRALARLAELELIVPAEAGRYAVPAPHDGVLAGAILAIANPGHLAGWHRHAGWSTAVGTGAMLAAHRTGRPAIMLAPGHLDARRWATLLAQHPSGIVLGILDDADTHRLLDLMAPSGLRLVAYGMAAPQHRIHRVRHDHQSGAAALIDWAVGQGRRRPAMLMAAAHGQAWVAERLAGYTEASCRHGLTAREPILTGPPPACHDPTTFADAVRWFTAELAPVITGAGACDALLVTSDHQVAAAAAAARRCGRLPGEDLLVLGYDGLPHSIADGLPETYRPPVSIDKANPTAGERLVALLAQDGEPRVEVLPPRLITAEELAPTAAGEAA